MKKKKKKTSRKLPNELPPKQSYPLHDCHQTSQAATAGHKGVDLVSIMFAAEDFIAAHTTIAITASVFSCLEVGFIAGR